MPKLKAEEFPVLASAQMWKHEGLSAYIEEETGVKIDPVQVALVIATRGEWRESDSYKDLVDEHRKELAEARAAKAGGKRGRKPKVQVEDDEPTEKPAKKAKKAAKVVEDAKPVKKSKKSKTVAEKPAKKAKKAKRSTAEETIFDD